MRPATSENPLVAGTKSGDLPRARDEAFEGRGRIAIVRVHSKTDDFDSQRPSQPYRREGFFRLRRFLSTHTLVDAKENGTWQHNGQAVEDV
jgi:hypothetical protein